MKPSTPVLVGVGVIDQREDDPLLAREPLALMIRAAEAAGHDAGVPGLLRQVDEITVPRGRWRYRDPGRAVAAAIGAERKPATVLSTVGVLQESLIGRACQQIADGALRVALVVGGEGGYRLQQARRAGVELADSTQETSADVFLRPADVISTEAEIASGLGEAAVGYYGILDSAWRAATGTTLDAHRRSVADLYAGFSGIAADNPAAWRRAPFTADEIRDPSPKNPWLALPYTRLHAANWSVDQASALLLCSAATAEAAGVPRDRWVFPLASAVSEHMVPISARGDLHRSPGAELAASRALDDAGVEASDIVAADLYTCFPVAVLTHAQATGLPDGVAYTVTGAMPFAGGPFNNYVLHSTAQLARRLRERPAGVGLVSCVSGLLTKHGFGVWSCRPPAAPFSAANVTDQVAAQTSVRALVDRYSGAGTIAGATVLFERGSPTRAVAVVDTDDDRRTVAWAEDMNLMTSMTKTDVVGRAVTLDEGRFFLTFDSEEHGRV